MKKWSGFLENVQKPNKYVLQLLSPSGLICMAGEVHRLSTHPLSTRDPNSNVCMEENSIERRVDMTPILKKRSGLSLVGMMYEALIIFDACKKPISISSFGFAFLSRYLIYLRSIFRLTTRFCSRFPRLIRFYKSKK